MVTLVHAMVAGASCINDIDVLRLGATSSFLVHRVMAPATLGVLPRRFTFGNFRRLDRVAVMLMLRAWSLGAGPGDGPMAIDIDSTICEVFVNQKQGQGYGFTHVLGYHPLLATRANTGETLGRVHRAGVTGASQLADVVWINKPAEEEVAPVCAYGSLKVLGQDINLSGTFSQGSSGVSVILSGYGNFNYGAYHFGDASFNLYLKSPSRALGFGGGQTFLTISATLNRGPFGATQLSGTINHVGTQVGIFLNADVAANIRSITTVTGTLKIGNCSDATCSNVGNFGALLAGSFTWQGRSYGFSDAAVAPGWGFKVTSQGAINAASGDVNAGLLQFRAVFTGNYSIELSSSSPYINYSAAFNARIHGALGHVATHCSGQRKNWRCHSASTGAIGTSSLIVGVSSNSQRNLSASYLGKTYSLRI